ncbi:uncharacterized protein [Macrobrachium rosenbergii]|uniref:uncharacterized protein n=1 Tax=Macrobrachium rosenbergii TaxID=79674 RepID=UPI0034D4AC99
MWVWVATFVVVAVSANEVYDPETPDTAEVPVHPDDPLEHKVHNLVLNPQQHSLCELKHIRQIITHPRCVSKEIENHVCVGTCFSYSVPQTEPETPGDELLDYCDSCQALESHWITLHLDCEEYGNSFQEKKTVQMITNCSCSPCHPPKGQPITTNDVTIHNSDHHVSELIYKMLPDTHKFKESSPASAPSAPSGASVPAVLRDGHVITKEGGELKYTEMTLGDLKKEFTLAPHQETLLQGRPLFRDSASFTDDQEDPRHLNY